MPISLDDTHRNRYGSAALPPAQVALLLPSGQCGRLRWGFQVSFLHRWPWVLILPSQEEAYNSLMTSDSTVCRDCLSVALQICLSRFCLLQLHLCSIPITGTSLLLQAAPPLFSASVLSSLGFCPLDFSLGIGATGSRSSAQEPESASRHLYAGPHPSSKQVADGFIPG